jgi:hypothetical protein
MATTQIYLKGKAKWVRVTAPDPKYGTYSMVLYPDEASMNIVHELKNGHPSILNELKKDDDGYNIKFNCKPNQNIGGVIQVFNVEVLDKDGRPTRELIGNGSDVTVKLDKYTFRKGEGLAVRLRAIRIDNLVPYEAQKDFTKEQLEQISGLTEQPRPLF